MLLLYGEILIVILFVNELRLDVSAPEHYLSKISSDTFAAIFSFIN